MAKADCGHSRPTRDAQSENAHSPHLARDLEEIAAELRQLRGIAFAHRELARHMLKAATPADADELGSSYQLCRLTEEWLAGLDDRLEPAIHAAMRREHTHG